MEYMVINPSWYVPRSIDHKGISAGAANATATLYVTLKITDSKGRKVNRSAVNFSQYNAKNLPVFHAPTSVKGQRAGSGQVYLPKSIQHLPARHACQKLCSHVKFARSATGVFVWLTHLISPMRCWPKKSGTPKNFSKRSWQPAEEQHVNLKSPVPVHIIYRTASTNCQRPHTVSPRHLWP